MKVLITGSTGFLGLEVARKFFLEGWEVVATGRNVDEWEKHSSVLGKNRVSFMQVDLSIAEQCRKLPDTADCIVHCAALSSPWGAGQMFENANVLGLKNLLNHTNSRSFVHISSSSVNYGAANRSKEREIDAWGHSAPNHYVATKRVAESIVRESLPQATVLRPHGILGERDPSIIPRVMKIANKGVFPLIGDDVLLDMVHVDDVASAAYLAANTPEARGRVYNIAGGQPASRRLSLETFFGAARRQVRFFKVNREFAMRVAGLMEKLSQKFTGGRWEPPLTQFSVHETSHEVTLSIQKATAELGYKPSRGTLDILKEEGARWR